MTFEPPSYGTVHYPFWGLALGWCMVVFILIWIPVVAVYKLMRVKGSLWKVCFVWGEYFFSFWSAILMLLFFLQRVKVLCSPSEEWHPYLDVHRGERYSVERCRQRIADIN